MSDSTIALAVLAGVIGLFVWNRLPVSVVALGTAVTLWATGLLDLEQALAGFGDPVVIFIATLFVVSEGIDVTGLTTWAGDRLLGLAGSGTGRLLLAVMALCAVLTALISLNGAVAALLPMAVVLALRTGRAPSRLLMPMAYAGSAGSLLVLAGSPVNIIVSQASDDAGAGAFDYFEFAWVGVPILIGTMAICLLFAARLVPERHTATTPRDLSRHAEALADQYSLADGFYRLRVRERSPLVGSEPDGIDLSGYPGTALIGMQAGLAQPLPVRHVVEPDDVLVVSGPADEISRLAIEQVLAVAMKPVRGDAPEALVNRQMGLVELVIPPRSRFVGETAFPGMVPIEDAVILAVQRRGVDVGDRSVELAPGDALLVYGSWSAMDTVVESRDVLVVDSPDLLRRQVPLGPKAFEAGCILAVMVVLLATGLVPPAIAGILAAAAMVLTKVMSSAQAYRAVSWQTVVLVGGLIPLSTAMNDSGAGERIADTMLDVVGTSRPVVVLAALFVLTVVLGLVISNTATVLIVLPIALATANEMSVSVQPLLMLIAIAASAALLTPVQTPGNMMIMAPGGYRFGDYCRLGLPVLAVWFGVALVVVPWRWPF
jgi:di/tricarboxylate transporter